MKSKKIIYILLLLSAIIVYLVYVFFFSTSTQPFEEPVQKKSTGSNAIVAQVFLIHPTKFNTGIQAVGTLLPNEEVAIVSETAGKVVGIYFDEGKQVSKGQLLVKVDDSELQAQLKRAEYQLQLTSERLNRQKVLLEKDAVSREEFDQVQTDYNILQTDIDLLKTKITKTEIRAPFGGTIGLRTISVGSYLQPNTEISTLVDQHLLKLEFAIPEKYATLSLIGKNITFQTEVSPQQYRAKVYAIEPKVDITTRTVVVRGIYDNTTTTLSGGMFARLNLIIDESPTVILIPTESVIQEMEGKKVWKVNSGIAKSQPITTGFRTETQVEVLSGLRVGDTIMTTGLMQVREGVNINIQ